MQCNYGKKSEVVVLDVIYKNEACHWDILDIMRHEQSYLGKDYIVGFHQVVIYLLVNDKDVHSNTFMDSDTPQERLEFLEPVIEDWHTLMCLLEVRVVYM